MAADRFERYIPQKELPDEIKTLPVGETRCEYCGVSYLVHHEVKRLEEMARELQTQLNNSLDKVKEMEETDREWRNERCELEQENINIKKNLQGKETVIHDLIKWIRPAIDQWRLTMSTIRDDITLTCNDMETERNRLVSCYVETFNSLLREKESLQLSLDASVRELKDVMELREGEREKYNGEVEIMKEKIKELETDRNVHVSQCEYMEMKCIEITQQLKTSEKERMELSKQLNISQHDIKNYKSKLKEYMTDNSSLRDELNQLKDKCDGISNGSQMERDRLMKEMDRLIHSHQIQLGEREREISHMNIKMERERQTNSQHVTSLQQQLAKLREEKEFQSSQHDLRINKMRGILTSEHNESLVKLKLTLQRQHELMVENERQCHIDELGQYREHYESKIRELETTLHKVNDTSKAKISELDGLLEKEKMMFDSEVMKHLMVEKELRMKLEKGEREMEEKRKSIDELKDKLKDCETEIDRERNEMKSSLEHEKHQLQEKLNEAYKEIGSLQSVIEKQVIERTHLIERYYSNRTK